MNDSTASPSDSGSKLSASSGDNSAASPTARAQNPGVIWRKYCWVPILAVLLSLGAGGGYLRAKAPVYTSYALLVREVRLILPMERARLSLPELSEETQPELMQGPILRTRALEQLRSMNTGQGSAIPLDKDGQPIPVEIRIIRSAKGSVTTIEACSTDAVFTQKYLDALVIAYMNYCRDAQKLHSPEVIYSIVVLQSASPAKQTYAGEGRLLVMAGCGGLGLGLAMMLLLKLFEAGQRHGTGSDAREVREASTPLEAGRLEHVVDPI